MAEVRSNWRAKQDGQLDWVPEGKQHLFPGLGEGLLFRDYLPPTPDELNNLRDSEQAKAITVGEERYGIGWRPGDPIPERDPLWSTKPVLNPLSGMTEKKVAPEPEPVPVAVAEEIETPELAPEPKRRGRPPKAQE